MTYIPRFYPEETAITAMCLWEAVLDIEQERGGHNTPWGAFRADNGTATLRQVILDLARECDAAWSVLDEDTRDSMAFDWEFCPAWLEHSVDWNVPHPVPFVTHVTK